MENNKKEQPIEIMVEQVHIPTFKEFYHMNESVDQEMKLYSEIASKVDELKTIYGEKAIVKTGIVKSLMSLNQLILTGPKEAQPQDEEKEDKKDKKEKAQAQPQPQITIQQPVQSQQPIQPVQAQQPIQPIPGQETEEK